VSRFQVVTLAGSFAQSLAVLRAASPHDPLAIACSGGLDSMVLLHLSAAYAREHGVALHVLHVHHGLSSNADAWRDHVAAASATIGARFDARCVDVKNSGAGTEAAARKLRYAALGAMCHDHGVTVLLQLLRGSGTAGLSGMDGANAAPDLLANPVLVMARPLLQHSRLELEQYAQANGITWVEDESNFDPRFARNALRHQVMPALALAFPGFQQRFARSAAHAQSAQRLLTELAEQDLRAARLGDALDVTVLRTLSLDRVTNLLRHWFAVRGLAMPSTAWLSELVTQLLEARPDAQLLVTHPACHLRRHRERLVITPKLPELAGMRDPDDEGVEGIPVKAGQAFTWSGEAQLAFPDYGGVLHFDPAASGLDAAWLRSQPLLIDFRKGGERLKLAANRPTRSLKAHYQSSDVPAWERPRLPVVWSGKALLFAAGIGMDCAHAAPADFDAVSLRWEASRH
jgi:tRNA(Ile)-lysidine synthase